MLTGSRLNTLLLVLMLVVGIAIVGMLATNARGGPLDPPGPPASTSGVLLPGTPISGATAITVPGHYYLTQGFAVAGNATGIDIQTSDVSLDLGGFTISGGGTAAGGTGVRIGGSRVHVTNGEVRSFQFGFSASAGTQEIRLDRFMALNNARGIHIASISTTIAECDVENNLETGIVVAASDNVITGCTIESNAAPGVTFQGDRNVLEDSVVKNNNLAGNPSWGDVLIQSAFNFIQGNSLGNAPPILIPAGLSNYQNRMVDNTCVLPIVDNSGLSQFSHEADHANVTCGP
jgi:parallel beta-helix repeat protein